MTSKKKKASSSSSTTSSSHEEESSTTKNNIMEDDAGTSSNNNNKKHKSSKRKKNSDESVVDEVKKTPLKVKIKLGDTETTVDPLEPEKKKKKRESKKSDQKSLVSTLITLLDKLFKADKKQNFWYAVPEKEKQYYQVIDNPMDLSSIQAKLLLGKYSSIGKFRQDLDIIHNNAEKFNGQASPIFKAAERLKSIYTKELSAYSDSDPIVTPLTNDDSTVEECMIQIIDALKYEDSYSIFHEPVPKEVPNYYETIKKPMDFATLKKKVTDHKLSISKFEKYMLRIFSNATKFNLPDTLYYAEAVRISKLSTELVEKLKSKFSSESKPTVTITVKEPQPEEKKEKKSKKKKEDKKVEKEEKEKKSKKKKEKEEKKEEVKVEPIVEEPFIDLNDTGSMSDDVKTPKKSSSDKKKTPKTKSTTKWKDRVRITDLDFPDLEDTPLYSLLELVWKKLMSIDEYLIFKDPVSKDVPNYHNTIKTPMDLTTIKGKIDDKKYTKWREFEDDVDLVYDNCKTFNSQDSIYSKEANRQHRWFRKWKKDMVTHFGKIEVADLSEKVVCDYFNEISVVKTHAPKYDVTLLNTMEEAEEETTLPKTSLCYHLLKITEELKKHDKNKYFWESVDESVHPNYSNQIKHSICLSMIASNCNNKHYKTIDQFINDIDLLHTNTSTFFSPNSKEAKESKALLNLAKEKAQPLRIKTFKDGPTSANSSSTNTTTPKTRRETRASSSLLDDIDNFLDMDEKDDLLSNVKSDKKKKPLASASKPKRRRPVSTAATNPYNKDIELGWVPHIHNCAYWQFPSYLPDPNPENRPKSIESNHDATQSFIDPASLSSSYSRGDDESNSSQDESAPKPKKEKKEKEKTQKITSNSSDIVIPQNISTSKTPKTTKKEKNVTIPHTPTLNISVPPFTSPNLFAQSATGSKSTAPPQVVHLTTVENRPLPKYSYIIKKYRQNLSINKPKIDLNQLKTMNLSDCMKLFSDDERSVSEIVEAMKQKPDTIPTDNLLYGLSGFKDISPEDDELIQKLVKIATKDGGFKMDSHFDKASRNNSSPKASLSSKHVEKDIMDEDDDDDEDDEEEENDLSDIEDFDEEFDHKKEKYTEEADMDDDDDEFVEGDVMERVLQDFETVTFPSTRRSTPEELFKKVKQTLMDEGVNIFEDE